MDGGTFPRPSRQVRKPSTLRTVRVRKGRAIPSRFAVPGSLDQDGNRTDDRTARDRAFTKLQVADRAHAIAAARDAGIGKPPT